MVYGPWLPQQGVSQRADENPMIPKSHYSILFHIIPYFSYPIGSMYAIYGNIYHQYNIPPMLVYIPYMDPMGIIPHYKIALLGIPHLESRVDPMEVLSCMALRLRLEAFRNETMTALEDFFGQKMGL